MANTPTKQAEAKKPEPKEEKQEKLFDYRTTGTAPQGLQLKVKELKEHVPLDKRQEQVLDLLDRGEALGMSNMVVTRVQ